jgi:hypothetical protein
MKIRNSDYQDWKSDNANSETGNFMLIKSEEPDPTQTSRTHPAEIKITFRRPNQRQKNGSPLPINLRKLLNLKHNQEDFNNLKTRD